METLAEIMRSPKHPLFNRELWKSFGFASLGDCMRQVWKATGFADIGPPRRPWLSHLRFIGGLEHKNVTKTAYAYRQIGIGGSGSGNDPL